ncbi:MAG TPA: hypothetical protein VEC37_01830 [Bacillota bacterium]|nr:hypothetical protein [Bacillota bacterium]
MLYQPGSLLHYEISSSFPLAILRNEVQVGSRVICALSNLRSE